MECAQLVAQTFPAAGWKNGEHGFPRQEPGHHRFLAVAKGSKAERFLQGLLYSHGGIGRITESVNLFSSQRSNLVKNRQAESLDLASVCEEASGPALRSDSQACDYALIPAAGAWLGSACRRLRAVRERELLAEAEGDLAGFGDFGIVVTVGKDQVNRADDCVHFGLPHAARCDGWSAETNAARLKRTAGFERDRVFVAHDVGPIEKLLSFFSCEIGVFVAQIDQREMIVGAAADNAEAALGHGFRHRFGVGDDLLLVGAEIFAERLLKANRF